MTRHLRRAISSPVLLTAVLAVAAAAAPVLREGWLLAWLLLGLASGYALSGST
ncbi:MAG: hypothetical protein QOG46_818 [Pseudonocardiales bacterium]|jgi:hypothetical protein|nr:hypothetical protein [Pseudonocardiales bacterium]